MADRNEADALFATKRKKQQEEQAEQERREEMSRKKAEMEEEIRRLEEEARRQKEQQEEARRQAEEAARRVKQEAEEAEARAERAREMAEAARRKQEELRREEDRRTQEKREGEKRVKERAAQEKAGTKKLPVLTFAIGGAVAAAVLVVCLVLFFGGKKGGVFGTDCELMAAKQVLSYDVFYPESFEEDYADGGVYLKYGSVEKGDFSFVYVLGSTQDDMNYMTESTDPTDLIHVMEEYMFGVNDKQVYKMTTGSGRYVYCSEYISFDISSITDQEEGVVASTSIMMLPLEEEYLVAVYATMKPSYEEALEEATASILDNIY